MAKVPAFAKAFAGRWRIVEMDVWDNDFLDLAEPAHLTFEGKADGEICNRLSFFLTAQDRNGIRFYIYDRSGKKLCGSTTPEPAGIPPTRRFIGPRVELLSSGDFLLSRTHSHDNRVAALAYYSRPHLESVADPATALQNRQLSLRQGERQMIVSRPGSRIDGHSSSLSARLDPPDILLTMTVREPPATIAFAPITCSLIAAHQPR